MKQTTKTLGQLAVVLALAAGVGLYAFYGVHRPDKLTEQKKELDEHLFSAAKADFVKLSITTQDGTTVLEKSGEWRIVSPMRARADKLVVDAVVSQLQTAKFKTALDEHPDDAALEKYGLKKPQFTVEAEAQVGDLKEKRSVKLEGGIENTFDGTVYLRRSDSPTVYMAEGGVRWALARSLFELRDKEVLAVDAEKVKQLAVKSKVNDWLLVRQEDKSWRLERPLQEPADLAQVTTLLGSLKQERALSFLEDTPEERKQLGFDAPVAEATLSLVDGQGVHLKVSKVDTKFYALREDADGAVLAEVSQAAAQFDKNPLELKDKTLTPFRKEAVAKVIFHPSAGPEVVVEKRATGAGADAWRVTGPKEGPAKVFKLTSVLWTLGATKGSKVVEEHPKSWAKYGLDEKARWIALFGADGKELGRFSIGAEVHAKPNFFYVRGAKPQVNEVDGSPFNELPFSVEELLDTPRAPRADAGLGLQPD